MSLSVIVKKASLVGAFFIACFLPLAAQALCSAPAQLDAVRVASVVDGDTLRLSDGRRVRLIGLNAPEMGRNGGTAEPFALSAKRRLKALIDAQASRVGLFYGDQRHDRYGRVLAHVYDLQGNNLEEQLLSEGLAYFVAVAPNTALVACHQRAEQVARQTRVGVWKQPQIKGAGDLRASGFALLQGRVEWVQQNGGGVWLDLDGDRVLRVAPDMLQSFGRQQLHDLVGREVLARGWVIDRQRQSGARGQARWALPLTDPAMLEVLR